MDKIDDFLEILKKCFTGKEKLHKESEQKIVLQTDLQCLNTMDSLYVCLVELDGDFYFADYGFMFSQFNTQIGDIEKNKQKNILEKLKYFGFIFDGKTLLLKTSLDSVFVDYTKFIMMMMYIQAELLY